ncbi:hypothetical protein [Endozoicomonas sp. Mp262]|uniref:DUF6933 domain-containing protein n=1 Tax=Endozoicomonas sp. Mp262 TaxID=2919499 RepID=UPI0021D8E030
MQDFLGVKTSDLCDISDSDSALGNWYTNIFTQERRKIIIFMNEVTLLSFIFTGVKKIKSKETIKGFPWGLEQLLKLEGFSNETIGKIIQENRTIELTSTNSRKLLGNMNDLISMYQYFIDADGGLEYCNTGEIIHRVNRTPQRNLEWKDSISAATAIIKNAT